MYVSPFIYHLWISPGCRRETHDPSNITVFFPFFPNNSHNYKHPSDARLSFILDVPISRPLPQVMQPPDPTTQIGSFPITEPPTHSCKRPACTPSLVGTNATYLVPEHIRRKFVDGWNTHVLLTYLTDKGCLVREKPSTATAQDILTIDNMTGQLLASSKPLSDDGKLDLSFDEWHQAWRRLLDRVIKAYLPDEFPMWEIHYSFILNNHNRAELWPLYLAYDAEIRKRSVQLSIDPSRFSIGISNDLESRYTAKKILSIVQADMKTHLNTRPSSTTRNTGNNHSFRTQRHHQHFDSSKPCRCIFCGDRTRSHASRYCVATTNTSGSPCHLLKQGPSGSRLAKSGKTYCFAWNGLTGCDHGPSYQHGEHCCTLCGTTAHNAQNCSVV